MILKITAVQNCSCSRSAFPFAQLAVELLRSTRSRTLLMKKEGIHNTYLGLDQIGLLSACSGTVHRRASFNCTHIDALLITLSRQRVLVLYHIARIHMP